MAEALPHINSHLEKPEQEEILALTTDGNWHIPAADGDFFACLNFNWNNNYKQLELNYNRTDNVNKQWGAASGFLALCLIKCKSSLMRVGELLRNYFRDLIQPPSILPISCNCSCNLMYFD